MKLFASLILALFLVFSVSAQTEIAGKSSLAGKVSIGSGSVSSLGGVANFRGMPSTEGNAVGTKTNNTCATQAYCTQLPDPTLAGNGIIVFYTYKAASGDTANTPTVFDCTTYGCTTTVDTFTHCGTDGNQATDDVYVGCFYTLTATTGSRNITVQWTAGVTQVSVSAASIWNATAADGYQTNSAATTGSFTSGSVTPSVANDLFFSFVVMTAATMPTNVGAFSVGSQAGVTWTADLADRRDATFVQHGIVPGTSALNPQSSNATTTDDYVALTIAFKSALKGTPPSGMYINHIYTVNSATGGTGNLAYQFPSSGNLPVAMNIGGAMFPTSMSDTVNGTWKACGPVNLIGGASLQANTSTYFVPNASPGLLSVTINTSGTGDIGPTIFYDIVGAPTTQLCNHASPQAYVTATAGSYTGVTSYSPSSSSGIALFGAGVAFNTGIGCTAPAGCSWDLNTFGAESLSGPEPVDENNMGGGHLNFTNNAASAVTWTLTSASTALNYVASEMASFQAPGSTLYPSEVKQGSISSASSVSSLALSYTPYQAGDLFAVITCSTNTTGTITMSDGTNTYNAVDGPTVLNGGTYCKTFYAANVSASAVTITASYSGGAVTFHTIMLEEFANASTLDQHSLANATASASTGIITSASFTTTSAAEAVFAAALCSNCDLFTTSYTTGGATTGNFTQENNDGAGNVSGFWIVSATGTYTATLLETAKGTPDVIAVMTFH